MATKRCPLCAEEIQEEARVCRFCHTEFAVTRRGYCANCHEVVALGEGEACPRCGGPVTDVLVDSRVVEPAPSTAAAPAAAARAGQVSYALLPYGESVQVADAWVKKRRPLGILGLLLVTLWVYHWYWYYQVNREMRDLGEDVKPWLSLLAVTLGVFLLLPPCFSVYGTASRIRRLQQRSGGPRRNQTQDAPPGSGWRRVVVRRGWVSPGWTIGCFFIPILNVIWALVWPADIQPALNDSYERLAAQ